jgi:hypothetical protein
MSTDIPDVDLSRPSRVVEVMHPRANHPRLRDLEMSFHVDTSGDVNMARHGKCPGCPILGVVSDIGSFDTGMTVGRKPVTTGRSVTEIGVHIPAEIAGYGLLSIIIQC